MTKKKKNTHSSYSWKCDVILKVCRICRIAVFSVTVFYDERIVIVAEQRPDANEEDSFQWMSRVLQVIHKQPSCSPHLKLI